MSHYNTHTHSYGTSFRERLPEAITLYLAHNPLYHVRYGITHADISAPPEMQHQMMLNAQVPLDLEDVPLCQRHFFSQFMPTMPALRYVQRLVHYTHCSDEAIIMALVLLHRIATKPEDGKRIHVIDQSFHRVMFTSILVSIKLFDDFFYQTSFYAQCGGISTREVNSLELSFLSLMNFDNLHVEAETYQAVLQDVYSCMRPCLTYSDQPSIALPTFPKVVPVAAESDYEHQHQQQQQCYYYTQQPQQHQCHVTTPTNRATSSMGSQLLSSPTTPNGMSQSFKSSSFCSANVVAPSGPYSTNSSQSGLSRRSSYNTRASMVAAHTNQRAHGGKKHIVRVPHYSPPLPVGDDYNHCGTAEFSVHNSTTTSSAAVCQEFVGITSCTPESSRSPMAVDSPPLFGNHQSIGVY